VSSAPIAAELLTAVEASPRATARHDRSAWVGLFTDDGCVEDPVGARPHIGRVEIGRFYDTFIGPRQITFHRDLDIVAGTTVIRDLTLEVTMGSSVRMTIPTFLRYDLRAIENAWRIARLRAYWELPAMIGQFLRNGWRSLPAALQLSAGLARNQRLIGTAGFLSGFRGAGKHGKRLVEDALAHGVLADEIRECDWGKMIASGNTIAASVIAPSGRGVLFSEVDRGAIRDVRYFAESPTDPA
jgi:transport factor 2 (NTF2)-like protein